MLKDLIIGSHINFARSGVDVNGVTPSALVQPANDADYNIKLGCVEDYEPKVEKNYIERRCPQAGGGKYRTRKKIPIEHKMSMAFSMQEWSELTLVELLHNAETPNAGAFVPNSRDAAVEGWLHITNHDQNNDLILDMHVYVSLDVESYKFGESLDPYALMAEVLDSALNDGAVTNL